MWRLRGEGEARDESVLRDRFRRAEPFPHLVLDEVLPPGDVPELLRILAEEPVSERVADFYAFDASPPEPATAELRELRDDFARAFAAPLARITGRQATRIEMRAYAYRPGHYLLPHVDHQADLGRELAFVYYVPSPEPPTGGELELFRVETDAHGDVVRTESALQVEPRGNRLVVFDVSDTSLHQVREVLSGLRISLAGWFYR
jgi:Rps23 Pro-64 3,4-dihydroxylase Tpa1-like proline 4-hydroxylase